MQTLRSLVFTGLISTLLHFSCYGSVIWESHHSPSQREHFSKISTVTFSATIPEEEKAEFLKQLRHEIGTKGELIVIDDIMKNLDKIFSSTLNMSIALQRTNNPSLVILKADADTQVEIIANRKIFGASIWEKQYLVELDSSKGKELHNLLNQLLKSILSSYFSSQESGSSPTFYFFFNP